MNGNLTPPRNAALILALAALPCPAAAGGWAFAPSAYTHNPVTGQRVVQYAQHDPVEGLPDPRQTVSRYTRTQTNIRGADGSRDTIYEVRSFGNTLGGFDAQRERGFDAQLQTLDALRPFRFNPYLFFGGLQGFGYGTPGYPAAPPGVPVPAPNNGVQHVPAPGAAPAAVPCSGPGCQSAPVPAPGQPGTAWPYAPPTSFVAPPYFAFGGYGPYGFGYPPYLGQPLGGAGVGFGGFPRGVGAPWWGYGPGRQGYVPGF